MLPKRTEKQDQEPDLVLDQGFEASKSVASQGVNPYYWADLGGRSTGVSEKPSKRGLSICEEGSQEWQEGCTRRCQECCTR